MFPRQESEGDIIRKNGTRKDSSENLTQLLMHTIKISVVFTMETFQHDYKSSDGGGDEG